MLKKWLSGTLAGLLCVTVLAAVKPAQTAKAAVRSAEFKKGYLRCVNIDEDGDGVYDYVSVVSGIFDQIKGDITVPTTINDLPVKRIEENAFYKCTTPRSFSVGENVEYIGPYAFAECTSLESISSDTGLRKVKKIDTGAFMGCTKLGIYLNGPKSTFEYIGDYAFKNCAELKGAELTDTLTYLGKGAFDGCTRLSTVTIPTTIDGIGEATFRGTSVNTLKLPENIKYIGKEAFAACRWLYKIEIFNSACSIYDSINTIYAEIINDNYYNNIILTGYADSTAEWYCNKYNLPFWEMQVYIPPETYDNLTYDKVDGFDCDNNQYDEDFEDGVFDCVRVLEVKDKNAETVVIPDEIEGLPVKLVNEYCFNLCGNLKKIVIGNNVVLNEQFYMPNIMSCNKLESVKLGKGTEYIVGFDNCSSLKSLDMSECDKLRKIAGVSSTAIESVVIPNGVECIDSMAFWRCLNLERVTLPDSVKYIGSSAFAGTPFLTNQKGIKYAGNWIIGYEDESEDLESLEIKKGVIGIADSAFAYNYTLSEVVLPETVAYIGGSAFTDNHSLKSITILNPDCEIADRENTICNDYKVFRGTIYGYEDSTAHLYAKKYDYNFESIGVVPWSVADAVKLQSFFAKNDPGISMRYDLNGDEILDVFDMILLSYK